MGIEDFYEFRRLIGRPFSPHGPAYERAALDPDAWERAGLRFARLADVWLHQPLTEAGFRGKSPRWVLGRGAVRPGGP
jgi:hypothetical protein